MKLSQLIKETYVGKYILDSEYWKGEAAEWKGRKITSAEIALGEGREDAMLYIEVEGDDIYEDICFYDNDTLILSDEKPVTLTK